jgi:biotin operon repressor
VKALFFAVMITFAASASAEDSIRVTTELTRNGEILDSFSTSTANGVTVPYRNVQLIKYRDGGSKNKVKISELEVGTTGSVTPHVSGDSISVRFNVNYTELTRMNTVKNAGIYIDQPQTQGYQLSTTVILPSGKKREFKSSEGGVEYVYTISAARN